MLLIELTVENRTRDGGDARLYRYKVQERSRTLGCRTTIATTATAKPRPQTME